MLAKKYRLPVSVVERRTGAVQRGRYVTVKVFPPQQAFSRLAVVVGAKVAPLATRRNAIKRAVYNALRTRLRTIAVADYLVIVQKPAYQKQELDGMINELTTLPAFHI